MPVILTPFKQNDLCHGYEWTVPDDSHLARQIACVALGQSRHVQKILAGANLGLPQTSAGSLKSAIDLLTVPMGGDPWHRDGWMFQVMSWIAANRASPLSIIRPPHMILAHKGFDGIQLDIDTASGAVVAAIIFEDKATDNPRDTIRDEVWPELVKLETGYRENVLVSEVVSLLQTQARVDPDIAIQNIIWKNIRKYRVSITIGGTHADENGHLRLFKGYDGIAAGDVSKRRGETLYVEDLRNWMESISTMAINILRSMI